MSSEAVIGFQPSVLRWARESLGLTEADVARKLHRPEEDVKSWEAGASAPTYPQLEKLAYNVLKRPLAVFFLPAPPDEETPEHEFRTLPTSDLLHLDADTRWQIRKAQAHQLALREVFGKQNPEHRHIWRDVPLNRNRPIQEQATEIRRYLNVTLEQQAAWKTDEAALKAWRQAIENAGIFVFKTSFKQDEISGFCLHDPEFPIIVLNNGNTKTRQVFSLLHELCHLLLQVSGITKGNTEYIDRLPREAAELERFCNSIAAEVLIPSDAFRESVRSFPRPAETAPDDAFATLARHYGVSREAVLRRMLDAGHVSSNFYAAKAQQWSNQRVSTGGGNYYSTQNVYLSGRFAKEVVRRHYAHLISSEQAAEYLGVRVSNLENLEERILRDRAA